MNTLLLAFGLLTMVSLGAIILIGYVKRRHDLISVRNLILLGGVFFVGASTVNAALSPGGYADYTTSDVLNFIAGVVIFFITFLLWYRWFKPSRVLGSKLFRRWPPTGAGPLGVLAIVSVVIALMKVFYIPIPGVAPLMSMIGDKAAIIALALAFAAWYQQKNNTLLLTIFIGIVLFAMVWSLSTGTGRRALVGVVAVFPVVAYWQKYRYAPARRVLPPLTLLSVAGLMVIAGYSSFRHEAQSHESTIANAIARAKQLPSAIVSSDVWGNEIWDFLGQNATEASLLAIHIHTRNEPISPFHSLIFYVTNPIPRAVWEDKPVGYGYLLPQEIYEIKGSRATWGPGIVGHAFHEGGLHMCVFYAVLFATIFRFFDELLMRQPSNPFLAGMLAAAAGDLGGLVRGDIVIFGVQATAAVIAGFVIAGVGRICVGRSVCYSDVPMSYVPRSG